MRLGCFLDVWLVDTLVEAQSMWVNFVRKHWENAVYQWPLISPFDSDGILIKCKQTSNFCFLLLMNWLAKVCCAINGWVVSLFPTLLKCDFWFGSSSGIRTVAQPFEKLRKIKTENGNFECWMWFQGENIVTSIWGVILTLWPLTSSSEMETHSHRQFTERNCSYFLIQDSGWQHHCRHEWHWHCIFSI